MLQVVQEGNPVLRQVAPEVPREMFGTVELEQIVGGMITTLDQERDGVAIAAPQVGVSLRIFVVRYDRLDPASMTEGRVPDVGVYINPSFVKASRRRVEMDEGCLSVRGIYGSTYRHERSTVRAHTVDGTPFTRGGGGVLSQVFQHEIDHLDGILFIDHAINCYQIDRGVQATP